LLIALSIGAGSSPLIRIVDVEHVDGRISVTYSPSVFAFSIRSFSRSSLQTPSKGESRPSTLEYFFCAMGPVMLKPSTDFASVVRRALGVVGEASDASDHPDHLEIVNVSATTSSKLVYQKRRALQ